MTHQVIEVVSQLHSLPFDCSTVMYIKHCICSSDEIRIDESYSRSLAGCWGGFMRRYRQESTFYGTPWGNHRGPVCLQPPIELLDTVWESSYVVGEACFLRRQM